MIVRDRWGKDHVVKDNYDNHDIIISTDHVFNEMVPEDLLNGGMSMFKRASTRVNESRDVTMIVNPDEPQFRKAIPGLKIGERIKNW